LGGKLRVEMLKTILSLDNVKHCIISNNKSFNLLDDNHKILFIRGIFHEMGLPKEKNNDILLLYCGKSAERDGGYTKQKFIELLTTKIKMEKPDAVYSLMELSNYRIYQLQCFINGIKPEEIENIFGDMYNKQPIQRTLSEPSMEMENNSEPVKRSMDNIDIRS